MPARSRAQRRGSGGLWEDLVNDLQLRLPQLSTRGRRVVRPNSGRHMLTDRAEAIESAERELWLRKPSRGGSLRDDFPMRLSVWAYSAVSLLRFSAQPWPMVEEEARTGLLETEENDLWREVPLTAGPSSPTAEFHFPVPCATLRVTQSEHRRQLSSTVRRRNVQIAGVRIADKKEP